MRRGRDRPLPDAFQLVVGGFILVAIVGTVISAVLLWRSTRARAAG